MTIADPNLPLPASRADAIELFTIGGIECVRPAIRWMEANDDPGNRHKWERIHEALNKIGYEVEELCGVPDGTFGAGGTGKGGGGG